MKSSWKEDGYQRCILLPCPIAYPDIQVNTSVRINRSPHFQYHEIYLHLTVLVIAYEMLLKNTF